jgi:hypothetical protein
VVNQRNGLAAMMALALGCGFNFIEDRADTWPALLIFVFGGFALGVTVSKRSAILLVPCAGALTNVVWRLAGWTDGEAVELPIALVAVLGFAIGATAIPTALLGMYFGQRRRSAKARSHGSGHVGLSAVLLSMAFLLAGCGDDGTGEGAAVGDTSTRRAAVKEVEHESSRARVDDSRSEGRRSRTLPNGTVIYPARPPATAVQRPTNRCAETTVRTLGGDKRRDRVPPPPGVRASFRSARVVVVRIQVGRVPSDCKPSFVNVLVDDQEDPLPPVARTVRLNGRDHVQIAMRLFDQMRAADTVRVTAGMQSGRIGSTAKVLITNVSRSAP